MKRLLLVPVLLIACRRSTDEPRPSPQQPTAPAVAPAPAPAPARSSPATTTPATPQPIAGVTPTPGDSRIKDFAFTSGEKLSELRIHYMTLGTARRDAAGHVTNAAVAEFLGVELIDPAVALAGAV